MTHSSLQVALNRWLGPLAGLADLDDGLSYAMSTAGYAVADPAAVADADLVSVPETRRCELLDVAGWRMLDAILNNLTEDMLRSIGVSEDADKVERRLRLRLATLYARIRDTYGVGAASLSVGVVKLNFQQQDDATTIPF